MPSFAPQFLDRLVLTHDVASTLRAIGEGKGRQELYRERAPDVLENLRQVAIIESTESSNRLEGVVVPRADLERLVRQNADPSPANRSEGEIAGYRNVLNAIHEHHDGMSFAPGLVRQLHRDLFRFSPSTGGEWKAGDNQITERHPDGSVAVRFRTVPPWQVPGAMEALHRDLDAVGGSNVDPLILIALYVLDFLCIHPFPDGNGRLARLLTVLLLYREEYEVARYVSLERLIEDTRESYYDTLYRASQGWHEDAHDSMPWVAYFLGIVKGAHDALAQGVGELSSGRGAKTALVLQAISLMRGSFSISELHQRCPSVGFDMVRRVLRTERAAGRLLASGTGRGARWQRAGERPTTPAGSERG